MGNIPCQSLVHREPYTGLVGAEIMILNPGYKVTAKRNKDDLPGNPGQKFLCPVCRHIILEATTEKFTIKCKHCGHWVYAEKVADKSLILLTIKK
jgi:DNA-directed RNA polymerase subunit RPC12/RpoP